MGIDKEILTNKLIGLLNKVKEKITDDSDVVWSNVDSPAQLRAMIDDNIPGLRQGNVDAMKRLSYLFAPTGKLQEHAISNGWSNEFPEIAKHFDDTVIFK